ncbi:hypothetical protein [Asticcacaulis taihuensis]|uniref:hypothetical protein n=1 Tax=Asticcacaulis taihuensis TaxID=260084 RepID=UPI0026EE41FD|nr:hypothetical protein [Asticcacaulis taihuensis]
MAFDWKDLVRQVAPTLGTALGGPLGGAAAQVIAQKMLGKDDATDTELANALIGATPEQLAALKAADNDFRLKMEQLGVNVYQIEVQDRSNARDLFKVNHWPQIVLSVFVVAGFFTVLFLLLGRPFPADMSWMRDALLIMLGTLGTAFTQVLNFWFGSTSGGQAKTNSLTALAATTGKAATK